MRRLYLVLAVIGFVLPFYFFARFLAAHCLNLPLLLRYLFANPISSFFAVDLIITALVFLVFSRQEAQRYKMRHWWACVLATLLVGPSFAFPIFLYFRESA
jgi:hypothetical protein